MIRFRFYLSAIALLWVLPLKAQTAKEALVSLPESLLPDLSLYNRMDLIDLYNAGQAAVVENRFNDSVSLEKLSPNYLLLKTGESSSLQIVVLPMINESSLYCLIYTICAPVCDSRIAFYSVSWNPLNADTFFTPAGLSWFVEENSDCPALDISLMQLEYEPQTAVLKQTFHTPQYLGLEDRAKLRPFIKTAMREYSWDGIRFQ